MGIFLLMEKEYMAQIFGGLDEVDQWNDIAKGWEQGALEHGKEICSSSSPTRCSKTKPADKREENREKKKLRKPGCHIRPPPPLTRSPTSTSQGRAKISSKHEKNSCSRAVER